ncbi:MAG: polysaccharide deacetylase family protein [Anaerolineae bacterium]
MGFYRLMLVVSIFSLGLVACSSEPSANLQPLEVSSVTEEVKEQSVTSTPQPTKTLPPVVVFDISTATISTTETLPDPTQLPATIEVALTETIEPTIESTAEPTLMPTLEPTMEATATVGAGCRPLDQTINYRNKFLVSAEFPPHTPQPAVIYNGFSNGLKIIHLGFDVERSPDSLGKLLKVLDRRNVKATMFVLGSWAEIYPEWIQAFATGGHELANHAWSHEDVAFMDIEEFGEEVDLTEAFVQQLTGKTTKPFFRPPFGSWSDETVKLMYEKGYSTVLWTGSAEDWRVGTNAETMCKTMLDNSYAGGLIYSHTWHPGTPEAIDRYIGEMQARGYTFVPMSVILSDRPQDYLIPNN